MKSFALGFLLVTLLCGPIFAQENSRLASPESYAAPIPPKTSDSTVTYEPKCTGCFLEAIKPTPLSYPGTVYCLNITTISTVPSAIRYTTVKPDGCTTTVLEPYHPTSGPTSTTSITWTVNGTTLTWPTQYIAYSSFQAGTWSHGDGSVCTIQPTTVSAQSPLIYPASSVPASLAPVPSQIVQSIISDPSISLPFNIATCTANGALPSPLHADPEPMCSCTTGTPPPQSCIQLPPSTIVLPNTFFHSGYRRHQAATLPARLRVDRDAAADAATATQSHTSFTALGIMPGGDLKSTSSVSGSSDGSSITSTSTTTTTTSTSSSASSIASSTNLSSSRSFSRTSSTTRSSGSSFVA